MEEASGFQMPSQLRTMFATILAYCQVSDVMQLFNNHVEAMTEDFIRHHAPEVARNMALHHINSILIQNSTSCEKVGLYVPLAEHELVEPEPEREHPSLGMLTNEQHAVCKKVADAVNAVIDGEPPEARIFFLSASGGCGKTFLFSMLMEKIRYHGHEVSSQLSILIK